MFFRQALLSIFLILAPRVARAALELQRDALELLRVTVGGYVYLYSISRRYLKINGVCTDGFTYTILCEGYGEIVARL